MRRISVEALRPGTPGLTHLLYDTDVLRKTAYTGRTGPSGCSFDLRRDLTTVHLAIAYQFAQQRNARSDYAIAGAIEFCRWLG
ncbi:hypothetical protein Q3C01_44510 [Bradyrhizobium sp. UFLA05-109]